jgi:hypothetical protein
VTRNDASRVDPALAVDKGAQLPTSRSTPAPSAVPSSPAPLPREELDTLDNLLIDYAVAIRAAMQTGDFPNMWQRQLDAAELEAREAIMAHGARLVAAVRDGEEETARLRDGALEEAALIADEHWPERGHVPQHEAVSCPMSISIQIRRRKSTYGAHDA